MRKLYSVFLLLPVLLMTISFAVAQEKGKGRISGSVLNHLTGKPLEKASVSCISKDDSTLISYTFSNEQGEFILEMIPREKTVKIFVSYYGFMDSTTNVELKTDLLNTGIWRMQPKSINLKGIEVTAFKAPFSIRNDTLEFDASAFKLEANAPVAALLKKLPGLVIDRNGVITVNGKTVNKIQVDGRDFFGDNKEATTNYLPADIIDKVQVVPSKTIAQQRSLAVKPPSDDITLNLTLKKDKKAGLIGNITAAAGTQQRYNLNGMVSSFRDPARISLLASAGNIIESQDGGPVTLSNSGGDGLTEQKTSGLNINTKYGPKLSVDGGYSYSKKNNTTAQTIEKLNLVPDNSFRNNSSNSASSRSNQHQLYTGFNYEQDSLTTWTLHPRISFGKTAANTLGNARSQTTAGKLLNTQASQTESENNNISIGNEITFNKTSRNRKFNMDISWAFGYQNRVSEEQNFSFNSFYKNGVISEQDSINQQLIQHEKNYTTNLSANLSADIGKGFVVALNYVLDAALNNQLREVFNNNKGGSIDSILSGNNIISNLTQTTSAQFAWKGKQLSIALNADMQILQQQNRLRWKDSIIKVRQQLISPNLQFSYKFKNRGDLYAGYSVSSSAPSAEQLSPVLDNSNPLFIKKGNPALKGTFMQNLFTMLYYYNPVHATNMNFNANLSFSGNDIVSDQRYDSMGRQISSWQNVNGAWKFDMRGSISKRKELNNWTISGGLNTGMARSNSIGFISGQKNVSADWKTNAGLFCSIDFKKLFSITSYLGMSLNKSSYSLAGVPSVSYHTKQTSMGFQVTPTKKITFNGNLNYAYNSQQPSVFVCGGTVAYKFLKKEQLVLRYRVNDIFNNNKGISRTTTATSVETREVNALRRYMMISISYFFGKMEGAQQDATPAVTL